MPVIGQYVPKWPFFYNKNLRISCVLIRKMPKISQILYDQLVTELRFVQFFL